MDCHLVDIFEFFEGPEYETLTFNQQMVPQYFTIWGKMGKF